MNAYIINIGDELLIGQVVNTNASWMAEHLNSVGIGVDKIVAIADQREAIETELNNGISQVDLVVITGGLGPTSDDVTKYVLADFFQSKMIENREAYEHIRNLLEPRGITVGQLNREQALVPEQCEVLINRQGTAPGMWFQKNDKIVVALPGVPFEMKALMQEEVLPRLKTLFAGTSIVHKNILTQGLPESILAEKIAAWENRLPETMKLAYLPNPSGIKLRLSTKGTDAEKLNEAIANEIDKLYAYIGKYIYGFDDDSLAFSVGKLLKAANKTVAVAESCTGGNISHQITLVPGCSEWFKGGVTAYANPVKERVLGVCKNTLIEHGAVSEEVVVEMAKGVRKLMDVDYAIATSGIAEPMGELLKSL